MWTTIYTDAYNKKYLNTQKITRISKSMQQFYDPLNTVIPNRQPAEIANYFLQWVVLTKYDKENTNYFMLRTNS